MSNPKLEEALGMILGMVLVVFGLGWVVKLVASGFDHEVPYWPTVGVVFLVMVLVGWMRGK